MKLAQPKQRPSGREKSVGGFKLLRHRHKFNNTFNFS
jgi:hypothetical protein